MSQTWREQPRAFQGSAPGPPSRLWKLLSAPQGAGADESLWGTPGLFSRIQHPGGKLWGPYSPGAGYGSAGPGRGAPPALSRAPVLNRVCRDRLARAAAFSSLGFPRAGINPIQSILHYQSFVHPVIRCTQPNTTRMTQTFWGLSSAARPGSSSLGFYSQP